MFSECFVTGSRLEVKNRHVYWFKCCKEKSRYCIKVNFQVEFCSYWDYARITARCSLVSIYIKTEMKE